MFNLWTGSKSPVGWAVTFENGWRLSVSFQDGSSLRDTGLEIDEFNLGADLITTMHNQVYRVEVMVRHTVTNENLWKTDNVRNCVTPDKLVKIMSKVRKLPDPTQTV